MAKSRRSQSDRLRAVPFLSISVEQNIASFAPASNRDRLETGRLSAFLYPDRFLDEGSATHGTRGEKSNEQTSSWQYYLLINPVFREHEASTDFCDSRWPTHPYVAVTPSAKEIPSAAISGTRERRIGRYHRFGMMDECLARLRCERRHEVGPLVLKRGGQVRPVIIECQHPNIVEAFEYVPLLGSTWTYE